MRFINVYYQRMNDDNIHFVYNDEKITSIIEPTLKEALSNLKSRFKDNGDDQFDFIPMNECQDKAIMNSVLIP